MAIAFFLMLCSLLQVNSASVLKHRQTVDCDFSISPNAGDTCDSFAADWGLTTTRFQAINPGVTCQSTLDPNLLYCVLGSVSSNPTTTTTATTTPRPTTTPMASTTPSTTTGGDPHQPTQSGLAANCNNFYLVASGDWCAKIEDQFGISAAQFGAWNPAINSQCSNLFLGYYVCVGVPGASTTSISPSPTSTGPQPQQPGIISSCKEFYLVQSGDTCFSIESRNGISAANFMRWNSGLDANCSNLWLGYYVCIGV